MLIEENNLKQKEFNKKAAGIRIIQQTSKTKKEEKVYESMIKDLKKQYKKDYSELKKKVEEVYKDGKGTPKMKLGSPPKKNKKGEYDIEFVKPPRFSYLNYHNIMLEIEGQHVIAMNI